ncbi:MAG: hypothetical protein GSR83_03510 [Desulfurococcales archaeon]|nr:hypothetical protein [Desulfurococcales archaeon]
MNRKSLYLMAGLALALALVNAAVFVYYPMSIGLSPQKPPVYFDLGSNANQKDLWGNTISVSLSEANTNLAVQVNPTYQDNYYKNITVIKSQDTSNTYYILFDVTDAITDTNVTTAELIVSDSSGAPIATIDLKSTGVQPSSWITVNPGETLTISLELTITPDSGVTYSTSPSLADGSATVKLIYSPQNSESP